jgi:hypothetical protein
VDGPNNVHCVTVATALADKMTSVCGKRHRWHGCCLSNFNGKSREGSKATGFSNKKAQIRNAVWMTRRILCL